MVAKECTLYTHTIIARHFTLFLGNTLYIAQLNQRSSIDVLGFTAGDFGLQMTAVAVQDCRMPTWIHKLRRDRYIQLGVCSLWDSLLHRFPGDLIWVQYAYKTAEAAAGEKICSNFSARRQQKLVPHYRPSCPGLPQRGVDAEAKQRPMARKMSNMVNDEDLPLRKRAAKAAKDKAWTVAVAYKKSRCERMPPPR